MTRREIGLKDGLITLVTLEIDDFPYELGDIKKLLCQELLNFYTIQIFLAVKCQNSNVKLDIRGCSPQYLAL